MKRKPTKEEIEQYLQELVEQEARTKKIHDDIQNEKKKFLNWRTK